MSNKRPASGPNLPDGCFQRDIDRAFGDEEDFCPECHRLWDECWCGKIDAYDNAKDDGF